jgi:hypothetical protein
MKKERNIELLKKWVEALRGGTYRQGKQALKAAKRDGLIYFCCFGVLLDLINSDGWKLSTLSTWEDDVDLFSHVGASGQRKCDLPSKEVLVGNGLSCLLNQRLKKGSPLWYEVTKFEEFNKGSWISYLIMCNDDNGVPFNQIADEIEQKLIKPYESKGEQHEKVTVSKDCGEVKVEEENV